MAVSCGCMGRSQGRRMPCGSWSRSWSRRLHFCYEAGPCGYGMHRRLRGLEQDSIVVAPSPIPSKPGDRVKTNRRDAVALATLHRAGELTEGWVPDDAYEAIGDLVRTRATARRVRGRARQHLQVFPAAPWPGRHRQTRLDPSLSTLPDHGPLRPPRPADRVAGLHPCRR